MQLHTRTFTLTSRALAVVAGCLLLCVIAPSGCYLSHLRDGEPSDDGGADTGNIAELAVGGSYHGNHSCALRRSGTVVCWGANASGQLGNGTITDRQLTPTVVTGLTDAVEITAGWAHTCARRTAGAVICWGNNSDGQLGDGTSGAVRLTPTPVSGLSDAVEINAGRLHTCARRAAGAVVCWGDNADGQLGDGTTADRLTPTPAIDLSDAVEISAGYRHTCALRSTGTAVCWGFNSSGQVGDGTVMTSRPTPTTVSSLTDAVQISTGGGNTCALRSAGAVVCWGSNDNGQVGDNTIDDRWTPTPVFRLIDAVEISTGGGYACARRSSGVVVCWGLNSLGEIGDGTTTNRHAPTAVTGLTDAVEISAGGDHTCARRSSGVVVCWGDYGWGATGAGTTTHPRTPTPVSGL